MSTSKNLTPAGSMQLASVGLRENAGERSCYQSSDEGAVVLIAVGRHEVRGDAKLETLLERTGADSLSDYLKNHPK